MRITIVTGAFLPVPPIQGGAVEKFWHAAGQDFARRGHEVTHISRAVDGLPARETIGGVAHVRVARLRHAAGDVALEILRSSLLAARPAGVARSRHSGDEYFLAAVARARGAVGKALRACGARTEGQMRFYRNAARLQAPSSVIAGAIAQEAPALADKVVVIPYAAPAHVLRDAPPALEERARTILYVGRLHPEKGVHLLIEAFMRESEDALRDWKLEIVGPTEIAQGGGGEEYAGRLRGLAGGSDKVIFRGPIFEAEELERAYRGARLFVYPSLAETGETFGLAALEAMSHRCAVLVSDLGCFHDFVHEGRDRVLLRSSRARGGANFAERRWWRCCRMNFLSRGWRTGVGEKQWAIDWRRWPGAFWTTSLL